MSATAKPHAPGQTYRAVARFGLPLLVVAIGVAPLATIDAVTLTVSASTVRADFALETGAPPSNGDALAPGQIANYGVTLANRRSGVPSMTLGAQVQAARDGSGSLVDPRWVLRVETSNSHGRSRKVAGGRATVRGPGRISFAWPTRSLPDLPRAFTWGAGAAATQSGPSGFLGGAGDTCPRGFIPNSRPLRGGIGFPGTPGAAPPP